MAKKKYTPRELMELAVSEMKRSRPDHTHKTDPKVGVVLSTPVGVLVEKAHRGEARIGDHAEYTLFERKLLDKNVEGYYLYTTLEPCIRRKPPKIGCTYRAIKARVGKVIIGHLDPDPNVGGDGRDILEKEGIRIEYFDKDLEEVIDKENDTYFREKEKLAKQLRETEISPVIKPLEEALIEFDLDDFSEEAQQEMISRMELPYKLGTQSFLKFLRQFGFIKLDKNGATPKATGLGLLLLGKNPQLYFPQARIIFTIFRGELEPIIKDFEGPILLMPGKVEAFLDLVISTKINRDKFHRIEVTDLPKKALREVIINAIVHRDYSVEGAKIMVDILHDKVAIVSPGIPKFPIEKFNSFTVPSIPRNQKIAYIFNQMNLVEERGLGMKELKKLKDKGLKSPSFRLEDNLFYTTIYRADNEDSRANITKDNSEDLAFSEQAGYNYLKEVGVISSSAYAVHFNVDPRTARRHLNKMADKKLVLRDGDGPSTVYRLREN